MTISLFVMVLGMVFLMLAGLKVPEHPRVSFGWLGLFFWLLATTIKI
jgi:hypothetical protein